MGTAPEQLTQAIAFHRWTLGTPIDDHFMTPEQQRQMPLPPEPAPQYRQAGQYLITQAMCTYEIRAEERTPILAAVRWPIAGVLTFSQGELVRNILVPGIYLLSSPLTESERAALRTRQETQLRQFDAAATQTRAILLQLTEQGADPLFVLSVLVRYMPIKGTETPRAQPVSFQSVDFDFRLLGDRDPSPLAPLADWDAGRSDKLPFRLEASKTIRPQPRARRRPGPAEMAPTLAMALLAEHFLATGHDRHIPDIADLVRQWAPWIRGDAYLSRKHVYNRVRRVQDSQEFRLVTQDEQIRAQAEAALFATHFPSR